MSRIILKIVTFEREIKIISNVRVSHNLKFFNNKKNVAIFLSRKNIVTSIKKKSKRFLKKNVVLIVFNKNKQFSI